MRWIGRAGIMFCGLMAFAAIHAEEPEKKDDSASGIEIPYSKAERSHWSFQPRIQPAIPQFTDANDQQWVKTPVDAFVLRKLKQEKLRPAPRADRRTLIRRLSFNLTGLPPSPEEVAAFVNDSSPKAYEKLVDRLLASPHYGERWGQHWLDVIRFSETEGFEYDRFRPHAWRFRDYVIKSFNEDKPYDQFVREQLAGDEIGDSVENRDALIAAGFHRLGPVRRNAGNADVAFSRNEILTDMTDMIGAAFLGLSVNCARCHDHMYDPIRQTDYYRMQAFLAATDENDVVLADAEQEKQWLAETDKVKAEIARLKKGLSGKSSEEQKSTREQLVKAEAKLPEPLPSLFSVKNFQEKRFPIHLLDRGDENKKQQPLGMRTLGVLLPEGTSELPADSANPKTLLANWIVAPEHPLTARVIVNRIWLYHFGTGLVSTPNDFGLNGMIPSHSDLLDWLANRFVETGWKFKPLHRLILLSSTYTQSTQSVFNQAGLDKDPKNRLLWHFSRRRLAAEEIRDAMLAVSGNLNRKAGGPSIMVPVDPELINLLYKPSQWKVTKDESEYNRRSIYLIAKRNLRLPFLEVFDQPSLQTSCFKRSSSTHAPQVLELLNGKLSNQLADIFAKRLIREAGQKPEKQIELAFQLTTGRQPTDQQKQLALEYLKSSPLEEFALAMLNLNAFLYVE